MSSIQNCPHCGSMSLDLQDIQSRNLHKGNAADFYCKSCKASGIIDIDIDMDEVADAKAEAKP